MGRGTVLVLDSSSPARLKCTATGNPVPVIQWFHNSVPILEEGEGLQEVRSDLILLYQLSQQACTLIVNFIICTT